MKHLKTASRVIAALLLSFSLLTFRLEAQMPCTLQAITTALPGNPPTYVFSAFLTGDSACSTFNPQYVWTIYGNPNITLTGPQVTHTFANPGFYMVCVQASYQGMTSSVCDTVLVQSPGSDCTPVFLHSAQGLSVSFNQSGSVPNGCYDGSTVYNWSFGDSSVATITGNSGVSHDYSAPGTYTVCVSTTTVGGQSLSYCTNITVNPSQGPFSVSGMIKAGAGCYTGGPVMVELYGMTNGYYDSFSFTGGPDSCYYWFQTPVSAQPAQYLIRATPLTGSVYLPTYYGDVVFWGDASVVTPVQNGMNYHIQLLSASGDTIPASGTLSGNIAGDGVTVSSTLNGQNISTDFDVESCRVFLLNSLGVPVAFTRPGPGGEYSFTNLEPGSYVLRIDHPGVPSVNRPLSIAEGMPAPVMNFVATEAGILQTTAAGAASAPEQVVLWPVPVSRILRTTGLAGEVQVWNTAGQVIMRSVAAESGIDVSGLPAGMYRLSGRDTSGRPVSARFVRQ